MLYLLKRNYHKDTIHFLNKNYLKKERYILKINIIDKVYIFKNLFYSNILYNLLIFCK